MASWQLGMLQALFCDSANEGGKSLAPAVPQFPLQNAANAAWIARLRGSRRGANRKYSCWAESQVPLIVTASCARVPDADASHMEGSPVVSTWPNMMPTHVRVCMLFGVDCHISAACYYLLSHRWHSRVELPLLVREPVPTCCSLCPLPAAAVHAGDAQPGPLVRGGDRQGA
jgi:hypothetical protein